MGLNVEVGTKLSPGSTGVQAYSLTAGFGTPQALIVWASNQAATGTQTAAGMYGMGWATYRGAAVQTVFQSFLIDPVNTASRIVSAAGPSGSVLLSMFNTPDSTTVDWQVSFSSFSTDTWSVDWTNLPAVGSTFLHYIVLGGSDITDALCGSFVTNVTPTSPESVALPSGFGQPDLLGFFMNSTGAGNSAGTLTRDFHASLGWAVSDTERAALVMADNDAATTMAGASWGKARALVGLDASAVAAELEMELDARASWPTDGFQVTFADLPTGLSRIYYLALKGTFQKTILESRTTATGTGNQDHAVGFAPKLAINWGHVMPNAQTIQRAAQNADATMFWHGATDGTNQAVAGVSQDDGKTTSFGRSYAFNNQTLHAAEAPGATTRVQASGSFSGNNVRLNYGTAHATARQFHLLALGDAASTGNTYTKTGFGRESA